MNDDTAGAFALPADGLAALAAPELQRLAAHMAQDAFGRLFRLTLAADIEALDAAVGELGRRAKNWVRAADGEQARALRLALLAAGIDQWGLAYCQAFGLSAIPGVSALLGTLRNDLDAAAEARFQQQFAAIEAAEGNAVDFKMELRRNIHLALWHAMIASEVGEEAQALQAALGSMMLALIGRMPLLGWRLVADALAHIQLRCLAEAAASTELARESTEALFAALRKALPQEIAEPMFASANQAVIAWQQSRRLH
ncbi:MAG: hypothetical protein K9K30_01340 [Burkholderiaceae bacterium]|nr:hypothetical protein [Sulfuritalea sp.]MCF8173872.1 hypothetical protein [Burkholderiaceae bacterium]MCF8185103.1 hypothetical protein [Polynucleobacter sp.]